MQLLQIKRSRNNDQVWLTFDDGSFIPFRIDDVVIHKIKTGTIDNYEFLCELSLKFLLNNYALRQVAISPKIATILIPKLKNQSQYYIKKYQLTYTDTNKIIDEIINYLETNNWLNQDNYAKFLLKKHHQKSRRYLEQLFSFYHLDKSLLTSNDKDNLKILLLKKITRLSKPLDFKTKNKLIQSFVQKGFTYNDIKSTIDESI